MSVAVSDRLGLGSIAACAPKCLNTISVGSWLGGYLSLAPGVTICCLSAANGTSALVLRVTERLKVIIRMLCHVGYLLTAL